MTWYLSIVLKITKSSEKFKNNSIVSIPIISRSFEESKNYYRLVDDYETTSKHKIMKLLISTKTFKTVNDNII